jgi:hypothetical protein
MEASDHPVLVPVARRTRIGRLALAVAIAGLSLAAAIWKPWAGPGVVERPAVPAVNAGGAVAPLGATVPTRPTRIAGPVMAGLDLSVMGTADPHTAWGVAVAYVSRTQFANALVRGGPTVTPVVSWELIPPDRTTPGPTLDHQSVTSVAIAATWPADVQPVAIRLVSYASARADSRPGRPTGPTVRPSTSVAIELGKPIAETLDVVPGPSTDPGPRAGGFYLPGLISPTAMAGWPGHGWPAAAYAFEVELDDGRWITLPFMIGATPGPG